MKEKVFNLFVFVTDEVIHETGAVCHERNGTDKEKLAYLQAQVQADLPNAKRYSVADRYVLVRPGSPGTPGRLRYQSYQELASIGRHTEFFEEVFQHLCGPDNPLMCVTPIVDGRPRVDAVGGLS